MSETPTQKKRFQTHTRPRFSDFDLQGVLNSRQYMDFVGEARFDQMGRCYGKPISEYTAQNLTFIVSEFHIKYLRPITFGMEFLVETEVVEIDGSKITIDFEFKSIDAKKTHASGQVFYHLFDIVGRRPTPVSDEDKQRFL
jgi:YbgC/YbaW family acyl-CoA thioester hydrolase